MNKIDRIIELLESIDSKLKGYEVKKNKKVIKKDPIEKESSIAFWNNYSKYYELRWKVEPSRNAMINSMIKNICSRIPEEDHQKLIHFFITQNDQWYLKEMHHLRCLLKDCEMLLTRMKSGFVITQGKARVMENASDNLTEAQIYLQNKGL